MIRGMSMKDAAEAIGMNYKTYRSVERPLFRYGDGTGESTEGGEDKVQIYPTLPSIKRVVEFYGLSLEDIVLGIDEEEAERLELRRREVGRKVLETKAKRKGEGTADAARGAEGTEERQKEKGRGKKADNDAGGDTVIIIR